MRRDRTLRPIPAQERRPGGGGGNRAAQSDPRLGAVSTASWAALGARPARRRGGSPGRARRSLLRARCGPQVRTEERAGAGPAGAGRAERPAMSRAGAAAVPRARRPRGPTSRRPAPRRAGRYPSFAEPPPASAPADWRSWRPGSPGLLRCLLSPPLGRAPRCSAAPGPLRRGRLLPAVCRGSVESQEEGAGAALSRLCREGPGAPTSARFSLPALPEEPRAETRAKSLPETAGRLRRRTSSPQAATLCLTPPPRAGPAPPAAGGDGLWGYGRRPWRG